MIRHRPFGSGHPYVADTDQRSPVDPVAGIPLLLGVRSSAGVTAVDIEIVRADGAPVVLAMERTPRTERGRAVGDGHLASAQSRHEATPGGWRVRVDDLVAGDRYRYRFRSAQRVTQWF
ncbi:MAG: glycoside hydrolase family 31, partial [Actinomycetota bacterium]